MFKNLKLMRKYQSILLFLGLFFVVFMLLITRQINVVKSEIETLNQEDIKVQELKDIQKLYLQGDSLVSEYISLATPEAIDQISAIAEETSASIEQTLSGVKGQDELLGKILDESQKMHQISGKLNANIHDFQV